MPIQEGNIKLLASQTMDDVPEGGGRATGTEIVDGASNAIFNDISELDRAGGRVSLRKTFAAVETASTDGYFGAHVIVSDPPDDANVFVSMFSTGDHFDDRADAATRVEAYLNAGPEWPGLLYENHIAGQRVIQLLQRVGTAAPPVGRTIVLRQNEGQQTQFEQYVRITRVSTEERTFTYSVDIDYRAQVITLDISDALRSDFTGTAANRQFARATGAAIVRDTVVADAATYYGSALLAQPAAIGDAELVADTIYTQVVPNARTEVSATDQRPANSALIVIATTPRQVELSQSPLSQRVRIGQENRGFNYVTILTPLPAPGSLSVSYRALGNTYRIYDNGDGTIGGNGAPGSGTVNYTTGSVAVTLAALPDDRSAVIFSWGQNTAFTNRSGQQGFRAPEYAFDLEQSGVLPGTFTVSWTSGGVVKTATDNGLGRITGDAAGEIVYISGAVYMRLKAMLDAGGEFAIGYDYATVVEEAKPGLAPDGAGVVSFTFAQEPVPGSVECQWITSRETSITSGATSSSSSTAKASSGQTAASATSATEHTTQVAMVEATRTYRGWTGDVAQAYNAPVESATVAAQYNPANPFDAPGYVVTTREPVTTTTSYSNQTSDSAGSNASSSSGASYSAASSQTSKSSVTVSHRITDDGAGNFYGTFGSVAYVGLAATLKVQADYSEASYSSNFEDAGSWEQLNATTQASSASNTVNGNATGGSSSLSTTSGGGGSDSARGGSYGSTSKKETYASNSLVVRYRTGVASPVSHTETYSPPGVVIDLMPYSKDVIVPGSVQFTWMGTVYVDFEGKVYRGRTDTDPGIESGSINYQSGLVAMIDYVVSGSPTALTVQSCWSQKPRPALANVTFQTQLSPIKPTGLVLSVLDVSGQQIVGTANLAGEIVGTHTRGVIDYDTGLVEVQFGDFVLDGTLTAEDKAEWWYDANDVSLTDGKIWRPHPIDPGTLRYSAVAFFYLPLDASILGLDPVRLPQDGRVPIFRPGSFAVVGHTATIAAQTVANAQLIDCGRTRLSRLRVWGADGGEITAGFTRNLDAGTVTFDDVTGYSQPVTIEHRVEDLAQVSGVEISGRLGFTRQLTHDFPVPGSIVSSALVIGDMRARVSTLFDQATWSNAWSDAVSGSAANGTYNDLAFPLEVRNLGAITERWAIVFTNTTAFNIIGEHVGQIATGSTATDAAPANPANGQPYFTVRAGGWGAGWAIGNVLRFNTVGAMHPVWIARTVQQGAATAPDDSFSILIRGDVDNP